MKDLFGDPMDLREASRRGERADRAHAARPGWGPAGETCGSCGHLCARSYSRTYYKCGLMRERWTGGGEQRTYGCGTRRASSGWSERGRRDRRR